MTEEQYGQAWARLARAEGHMKGVPQDKRPSGATPGRKTEICAVDVRRLKAAGLTNRQVAAELGCSHGRISQIMNSVPDMPPSVIEAMKNGVPQG